MKQYQQFILCCINSDNKFSGQKLQKFESAHSSELTGKPKYFMHANRNDTKDKWWWCLRFASLAGSIPVKVLSCGKYDRSLANYVFHLLGFTLSLLATLSFGEKIRILFYFKPFNTANFQVHQLLQARQTWTSILCKLKFRLSGNELKSLIESNKQVSIDVLTIYLEL